MDFVKNFARDESGASAAEYALILVVIGLVIVGAATTLSGAIGGAMDRTSNVLNTGGVASGG